MNDYADDSFLRIDTSKMVGMEEDGLLIAGCRSAHTTGGARRSRAAFALVESRGCYSFLGVVVKPYEGRLVFNGTTATIVAPIFDAELLDIGGPASDNGATTGGIEAYIVSYIPASAAPYGGRLVLNGTTATIVAPIFDAELLDINRIEIEAEGEESPEDAAPVAPVRNAPV
uniref:Uncharacterized protein n=1 Tax=Plectus sambesii TaxID=2011161 RepID=A0A914WEA3_9BILA